MNNNFLAHYGVKGMKWGVRNDDSYSNGRSFKQMAKDVYSTNKKRRIEAPYEQAKRAGASEETARTYQKVQNSYRNSPFLTKKRNDLSIVRNAVLYQIQSERRVAGAKKYVENALKKVGAISIDDIV